MLISQQHYFSCVHEQHKIKTYIARVGRWGALASVVWGARVGGWDARVNGGGARSRRRWGTLVLAWGTLALAGGVR